MPHIMQGLLIKTLTQEEIDRLSDSDVLKIQLALVKNLLRVSSYDDFTKELSPILRQPEKRKKLRSQMLFNFESVFALKHTILTIAAKRIVDPLKRRGVFERFGIEDHSDIIEGLKAQRVWGKVVAIARNLKLRFENTNQAMRLCTDVMKYIRPSIISFAYKKLRFVVKSNNLRMDDIISDLYTNAVEKFFEVTPFLSIEHTINMIKRALHNKGINMIKYYQADKRRRLNDDGTTTITGLDYVEADTDNEKPLKYIAIDDPEFARKELLLAVNSIYKTHGHQPRKRTVLDALFLQNDPQVAKVCSNLYPDVIRSNFSVPQIIDKVGHAKFLEALCVRTGACRDDFDKFIRVIQCGLAPAAYS